jgi:uncharacterized phage protein (TIGR01671 family)
MSEKVTRKIKFRQALFSVGKFCGFHYWGFYNGSFIEPAWSEGYSMNAAEKRSCQFTGLLDKNGREIYEGDILRTASEPFWAWLVKFGAFYAYAGHEECTDSDIETEVVGWFRENQSLIEPLIDSDDLEVIGNICENPELLKDDGTNT